MARRGVWELNEVILRYCLTSGSSRGVREFVEKDLVSWAEKNPQISFKTLIRGGHPCVYGKYRTGYERQIGLKNKDLETVNDTVAYLRNTLGRKVPQHSEISIGVVEKKKESVQGFWRNSVSFHDRELPETIQKRAERQAEYNLQKMIDDIGMNGVAMVTQKLLERQELAKDRAIAAAPKPSRVLPTE